MLKFLLFRWRKWTCIALLLLLLYILNTTSFWQMVYPISYENEILEAVDEFGVDPFLIMAIIQTESRFEQDQQSHMGARGVMQLMPDTARWANEISNLHFNENSYLWDARVNIFLGTWYLSFLLEEFAGDHVKVIAAYNAGQGAVHSWLERQVWDGTVEQLSHIPYGETRHYLARVLFYYSRYQEVYQDMFPLLELD